MVPQWIYVYNNGTTRVFMYTVKGHRSRRYVYDNGTTCVFMYTVVVPLVYLCTRQGYHTSIYVYHKGINKFK